VATQQLDFNQLSLRDALDLAVLIEEEARARYVEFAEQMEQHRTPEAGAFFRFMAGNELKHRDELAKRRAALFGAELGKVTQAMVFDVEAPEYDEARAFMTLREALKSALRSEQKAREFFAKSLPVVKDAEVATLFAELLGEEEEHEKLVRDQIANLPPDAGAHPGDFADEPTAQ
jgi:rubrerythrin